MTRYYFLWLYAVILTAIAAAAIQSTVEEKKMLDDSAERLASLSTSLEESVAQHHLARRSDKIARSVERLTRRTGPGHDQAFQTLLICVYSPAGAWLQERTLSSPRTRKAETLCLDRQARRLAQGSASWKTDRADIPLQIHASVLPATPSGHRRVLLLSRDLGFLRETWLAHFLRTFLITAAVGLALLLVVGAQVRHWLRSHLSSLHHTLRSLLAGRRPHEISPVLKPLSSEIALLAEKVRRSSAPPTSRSLPEAIGKRKLVILANREPYIHEHRENQTIRVVRPASGLVSALEPILRQCGGLWIAHGSGSADREVTGADGEIAVPPDRPRYRLRRVWLSEEQEKGYYYGFSNEGLWPLCHLAHTRPIFRLADWNSYREVNQRFVDAIPATALTRESLVLVQDYHFALAPRAIKLRAGERGPRVAIFWHIPWPNPEAFGICPWSKELLEGMLGADVIGFHTQYHCNNFLETCNRYLEARIDLEHFSVTRDNHETMVRAFPIGIDTPPVRVLLPADRERLREKFGARAEFLAVGVDRIDYTKGLVERVQAVERFLEKNPQFIGRFSLLQVGSPSRSSIPAYRQFLTELEHAVTRVNARFGKGEYKPILFVGHHQEWEDLQDFYQLGDVCLVTSLHDGMNLVAKEYVWCQQPERGSLILSKFTGASRELTEAFIVNPYSIEEMADAIAAALALPTEERTRRMLAMREKIRLHNAYQWASDLIQAVLKTEEAPGSQVSEPPSASTATSLRSVAMSR
ncbi:MAG: trehalose-6-phosphate synthase [Oligoflexia bacterium]|nr:trehalose-6-phosphate synthase [Oligoflexia bacterium]